MTDHPSAAAQFNQNPERVNWHDQSLWLVREKRDKAAATVKKWEELRTLAAEIKGHTLAYLDQYLLEFEKRAIRNGVKVHWAEDAEAHNKIVYEILEERNARKLVKSKSMLTEECGLNHFLEENGIEVTDTDLGERIVQLAKEPPSHIVMPAIHKKREEIDILFQARLQTKPSGGDADYLTRAARNHLRQKFLEADAALTGVNFAVAETGGIVVCTNEGNADMGVHATNLHIACMGIEKVIPKFEYLGVFLRLLARSATGQPITVYSSHYQRPAKGKEMHIVIVDNGRSRQLANPDFQSSLRCIRCGACLNTCPVYRRSGGHSYGATVPGPIGSILYPNMNLNEYKTLPFASSLCGSCSDVCPVKIDIHTQLYKWRQVISEETQTSALKKIAVKIAGLSFSNPKFFKALSKLTNKFLRHAPPELQNIAAKPWAQSRDLPQPPDFTFAEWYKLNRKL